MSTKMSQSPAILTTAALVLLAVVFAAAPVSGVGGIVGGRTKIEDVKGNKEVQDLGKYSVKEYNKKQRQEAVDGGGDLTFKEVVEAEKQVVSGIKYYLTIAADDRKGLRKTFEAVVVVKPWERSKELVRFAPAPKGNSPAPTPNGN